jgi:hypothetical protein
MAFKNLVTQGELKETITGLNALAANLSEHVNQSLSRAHGWSILDSQYFDTGGNYHTDSGTALSLTSIPGLYSTGVNNDGTLAAPGTADSHWTLIQSPDSNWRGPAAYILPVSAYPNSGPAVNSQWLGPASSYINVAGGTYKYRISFNLAGLNPVTAIITGLWQSDNQTISILLNGLQTGYQLGDSSWTTPPKAKFQLTGPFLPGLNTLDFIVNNSSTSPSGLRVELTSVVSPVGAVMVPGIFNTGVNNDGSLASLGSADQHWSLILSADPAAPGPNAYICTNNDPTWAKNTSVSQWIGPKAQGISHTGNYAFRLSFNLTGYVAATAVLKGTFVSCDTIYQVLLNGQVTGINNGLPGTNNPNTKKYTTAFIIITGFQAGLNTLDFYLYKSSLSIGSTTNTGIKVEIKGIAAKSGSELVSRVLRLTIAGNVFYIPAQASGGMDGTLDPVIPPFNGIISLQSADPATDLTTGSPTSAELVTTFAAALNAVAGAASDALLQHAGIPAENVHGGLSWQQDSIVTTGGYVVGRRSINLAINGVQYKLVADTNLTGPLNS